MGTILDDIYDVIFSPRTALREIAARRELLSACIVFLLSVFIPMWAVFLGLQMGEKSNSLGFIMVFQVIGSIAVWVVGTAIWHLCAELLGGRGSAVGLMTALGFSHFPRIFIVPLWVLATLMPAGISPFFIGISGFIILVWTLSLEVLAISGAYDISRTKAVIVFLAPVLLVIAAVVGLIFMAGSALIQLPLG
ncbi:Yip1 family protein [Dendrosporobacter sp. 1207_IL3150]|uniref:Yip1 family protein n=1 Tax=Dendrosporobacter sp. 1207_IL3150 TaxID=3084054 RepID=UPI002FD91477